MRRPWSAAAALLVAGGLVAGCGGGAGGGAATGSTSGADRAPTLAEAKGATGKVTFCAGKDTSGAYQDAVDAFDARYRSQGLSAKLVQFPAGADQQREQAVQRLQARSSECDVFQADVTWIAEFASQRWLLDLTDYVESRKDEFIPSTIESQRYDGRYWGVLGQTGAGLIYRDTSRVADAPGTWQQLYAQARSDGRFAYQGAAYEGLTVNFLEVAFAAGGRVLSDDGTTAEFDSPENLAALKLMVDGIRRGEAVKATTTYMEEEARQAFERGTATAIRNWSYVYGISSKAPRLRGKVGVSALPAFAGGGTGGVLGGNGPVISAFSANPKGALLFVDQYTSAKSQTELMAETAVPATVKAAYDDPAVRRALPFSDALRQGIEQARPRPVSPVYPQISRAIYENVNEALSGEATPEAALKAANAQIEKALATF